jgi:capsular exopolysaccharide synthesis family protein
MTTATAERLPTPVVRQLVKKTFSFPDLAVVSDPTSAAAESIRALRTRLQNEHLKSGGRAVAVCAPALGVGCSFVAANLAVAMAQAGVNTLLIDANLRAPGAERFFGLEGGVGSLAKCLSQPAASLEEAIQHQVQPSLDVLLAGRAAQPQELLASARFGEILHECFRDYDMTIVDTPPANSSADSMLVANGVGFALIVARKNKTLVADVRTLAKQIRAERAEVLGTVLTSF